MKYLHQVAIIIGICFLGELLHQLLNLPIPGSVLGMIIMFAALCTGLIKLEMIEELSNLLLSHLAFFLVPAGVGVIASLNLLHGKWPAVISVCLISTVIVMIVTGYTIQWVKRGR